MNGNLHYFDYNKQKGQNNKELYKIQIQKLLKWKILITIKHR